MSLRLSEVSVWTNAERRGADLSFDSVSIDSRHIQPGDLYVALKGDRFDGHSFVADAEKAGAIASMTEREISSNNPQIQVEDSRLALAKMAGGWRWKSGIPVIAVTGSNGKTSVKEMVAAILGFNQPVLATKGNLNNEIGVPLTLLSIRPEHRYAVVEMGASRQGDIAYSCEFAQHDVGIITNAGAAHLAGFGDLDGVARAKGEMVACLPSHGIAVLNKDDQYFSTWQQMAGQRRIVSFGLNAEADFSAKNLGFSVQTSGYKSTFMLCHAGQQWPVEMVVAGEHNICNALAAAAACHAIGIDIQQIQQGLAAVKPVKGRLQPKLARTGALIIDDSYNGNPSSLKVALSVLKAAVERESWLVLGDFAELGPESPDFHRQVGEWAKAAKVDRLFVTGHYGQHTAQGFGAGAVYFEKQQELIDTLNQALHENAVILIKGSRSQAMERVVEALSEGATH